MSNFGALTDHFSLTSANLVLVSSSETVIELSRADALDEKGDIAASTYYGNLTQDMREISCTYALISGTLNINTIKLGQASASTTIIESVEATTSNSEFPQITVTGRKNAIAVTAPSGFTNQFTLPSISLTGSKFAQVMDFTVAVGSRLTTSSLSASVEIAQQDNGLGEPIAHGLSGGQGTITAELVRITAAPAWTVPASGSTNSAFGITETQVPGAEQGQAAYHTASATASFTVTRDNS